MENNNINKRSMIINMGRRSSLSFNIAYCGIIVAFSVIVMLAALIPTMTYVLPAFSGMCIWTVSEQISRKWGLLSYAASAVLCFVLIPEIEADLYYAFLFGFYPLIKELVEKIRPKLLAFLAKLAIFNIMVVAAFWILSHIMNLEVIIEGLESFGEMAVYVLWGAANVVFVAYDFALGQIFFAFRKWVKPKLNKKLRKN